jgi:hypothetical protein
MKGAIFFSSRYGSTAEYAQWIAEATGLPVFDVDKGGARPSDFDFLVLGSPVIYHKLMFHKWIKRNLAAILARPVILFSVSGAGAGPKLDAWMAGCLPAGLIAHVEHVALRGRQNPGGLGWYDRIMLIIGGLKNPDRVAGNEELHGFDFMDRASIGPIVEKVAALRGGAATGR